MNAKIDIPMDKIEAFCKKYQIVEFSLFGSVLRDDFRPDSDVDVLVTFANDSRYSLLDIVHMRDELSELFGREVDFVEQDGLVNPFRRREILNTKKLIYAV